MKESNEILMNKVEGSVLTDSTVAKVMNSQERYAEEQARIGRLEGNINTLNRENEELKQKLENSEKQVTVTVRSENNNSSEDVIAYDPYSGYWNTTKTPRKAKTYIDKITTINIDDLHVLVDNAVRDEANQLVKEADLEIEKANKKTEKALEQVKTEQKVLQSYKDSMAKERKEINEKINKAVERAQTENLDKIADLKLEIKEKNSQLETSVREMSVFVQERDIVVENLNTHIDTLQKQVELLKLNAKDVFQKIRNVFTNYRYSRRITSMLG